MEMLMNNDEFEVLFLIQYFRKDGAIPYDYSSPNEDFKQALEEMKRKDKSAPYLELRVMDWITKHGWWLEKQTFRGEYPDEHWVEQFYKRHKNEA